jgi:hypothetical protein
MSVPKDSAFHAALGIEPEAPTWTRATSEKSRRIRWAYAGRLALGYLAVWSGAGDVGKSLFAAWVIGRLGRGELDGEFYGSPQDSLIIATEDGREDMWKPRLVAVGADLERVSFLDTPDSWNLRDGIDIISAAVDGTGARLVFVDAAMEHMPPSRGGENVNSPTFVRGAMGPLARLTREREITSLFGLHPPKARAGTFADAVQASGAFSQLARIGLLFGYHPDDLELPREQQRRVVLRGKGNAGRNPGALSYRIAERIVQLDDGDTDFIGYVCDVQPCDITESQLLRAERPQARDADERQPTKAEQVERLILERFADGEERESMRDELIAAGYAATTVDRARQNVCMTPRKQTGSMTGPWMWRLRPEHVRSTRVGHGDFVATRGGPPSTMREMGTSGPNPNKQGKPHLTHLFDEKTVRVDELPISHNAEDSLQTGEPNGVHPDDNPLLAEMLRRHGRTSS